MIHQMPEGLAELRNILEVHISNQGLNALSKWQEEPSGAVSVSSSTNLSTNSEKEDSNAYVSAILDVHAKYDTLVKGAFRSDPGFVAALDKACGKFINNNAVTRAAGNSSKSPELLARYCDGLLKKSSKNPEEERLEDALNQVVSSKSTSLPVGSVFGCLIFSPCSFFRWSFSSISRTRTCSRSSTRRCWPSGWSVI